MRFFNWEDGGKALAKKLTAYKDRANTLVLALPRAGVPVAFEITETLHLPLDIMLVRKLGVPGHEELAMGAIANGHVQASDAGVKALLKQAVRQTSASEVAYGHRRA